MPALRASEWITLLAFSWFSVLACGRRRLDPNRRVTILAFGLGAIAITIFASLVLSHWVPPQTASIVRDWVPYLFLFLFYSQGGQFVTGADRELETRLLRLDQSIVAPPLEWCAGNPARVWIFTYLELAYMSYYPVLPLSLAVLYLSGRQADAARFWTVVLLAAYGSCGTLPYIQIRPPRMLGEKWSAGLPSGRVRAFNLWILQRGSIQANTLPSAHVAITTACALSLLRLGPVSAAVVFLWIAVSVALGAVAGRYHYALDAILGFLVAGTALAVGVILFP
uniref:Inositolphosphotransferase Aur1/Ipt1 domain-containing protein n=1 Tax=Solibacter usitatus (strain Ellin6076) TaxID=234267 RepID=Q025H0_SOLUE